MSTKTSRSGGKFGGSHTTVVPAAGVIADIAAANALVTKVSPGFIKAGLPSAKGRRSVKIRKDGEASLLVSVRDNTTHQDLRVYGSSLMEVAGGIQQEALRKGFVVTVTF